MEVFLYVYVETVWGTKENWTIEICKYLWLNVQATFLWPSAVKRKLLSKAHLEVYEIFGFRPKHVCCRERKCSSDPRTFVFSGAGARK